MLSSVAFELDEDQRALLLVCLRAGAEKFCECAALVKDNPFLNFQFEQQKKQALELSDRIENAEYIKIGPEES